MELLFIKVQFVFLFFLYIYFFFKLLKRRFSFSLGLMFGVLFFIFIPMLVLFFTNIVEVSKTDFSTTRIQDVCLQENTLSSLLLIGYLYSFLLYIITAEIVLKQKNYVRRINFPIRWKSYFALWLVMIVGTFMLIGMHEGGHWYKSREVFNQSGGIFALLLSFSFTAITLVLISSLVILFKNEKMKSWKFLLVGLFFSVIDILLTGNRIFVFVFLAAIAIVFIQRYRFKSIFAVFFVIPFGYFMSIYQQIRGKLFLEGIPSLYDIIKITSDTLRNKPPEITGFLLGISGSVNFNVLYQVFNTVSIHNILWGETYAKLFTYFIPRSIWPDKPLTVTQVAGEWFAPAIDISLATTLIGEIHMNFFVFGIILLPILLLITKWVLEKVFYGSDFEEVLLFLIGILIFRMSYSDVILYVLFIALFYFSVIFIKRVTKLIFLNKN